MLIKNLRFTAAVVLILALVMALPCPNAVAEPRGGGGRGGSAGRGGPVVSNHSWGGGGRHYYSGGNWYRHGWFGFDTVVSALAIGALIDSLPPRHTTVVVAGTPYYYYDNYYYQTLPSGGYVVVPPPVLAQPVAIVPQAQDILTINIPNARGGYTAVTLKKAGTGYVGPQGEYYSDNPTVEQLKVLYGK